LRTLAGTVGSSVSDIDLLILVTVESSESFDGVAGALAAASADFFELSAA
jgi:hypothetical protein